MQQDYRVKVKFTAQIAVSFQHGVDPIFVSVSALDVEDWLSDYEYEYVISSRSKVNPAKLEPGVYALECETTLEDDDVLIDVLTAKKIL